jgi:hypothetical protein
MIKEDIVTFMGDAGNRQADLSCFKSGMTTPVWIVDFKKNNECFMTRFYDTESEAQVIAEKYAYEGVVGEPSNKILLNENGQ